MFENGAMPYWYDWGPEEADRLAGEIVAEKRPEKCRRQNAVRFSAMACRVPENPV